MRHTGSGKRADRDAFALRECLPRPVLGSLAAVCLAVCLAAQVMAAGRHSAPATHRAAQTSNREWTFRYFPAENADSGGKYQAMEEAMLAALVDKAYYAPGRGILYEVALDWSPLKLKGNQGGNTDWVTTEAMGCAMMALFSLNQEDPW